MSAIAISHPHFYTTLVEWSRAFGDVPVHVHADDSAWVMRPDPCIKPWRGETLELLPGVTLIRGGGHFPGGTMLHWAAGAEGRGVVCSADIATVNLDRKSFTFMRSYPNHIPLSANGVRAIGAALAPFQFDRVYSHFFERVMLAGAKQTLQDFDRALCRGHRRRLRSDVIVDAFPLPILHGEREKCAKFTMPATKVANLIPATPGGPILPRRLPATGRRYQHPTWQAIGAWKVGHAVGWPVPGGSVHPLAAKRQQWRGPAGRLSRLKV